MTFPFPQFCPGSVIPSIFNTYNSANGTTGTTQTFTAANLGTPAAQRYMIVAFTHGPVAVNTVTINGVSASVIKAGTRASIWGAAVPTGSTGNIVIGLGGSTIVGISAFSVYNLISTTATDTATADITSGSGPVSANVNTLQDGIIIGVANCNSTTNRTISWSGLTLATTGNVLSGTTSYGTGYTSGTATASPTSVSMTLSGATTASTTTTASFR